MDREVMEFDVLIVGAGPSGLATAIRIKQLCQTKNQDLSVCVIEKGSEVGAHILSGAVMEPRALNELFPDWKEKGAPLNTPAGEDRFLFLTERKAYQLPTPPSMRNRGNFVVSLGNVTRWLANQAEALGVEIFAGFAGAELLYRDDGSVAGVATGDMGIGKDGQPSATFTRGVELRAKQTVFAEGCRGSLTRDLCEHYGLRKDADPPTYGIGLKELWEVDPAKHRPGHIMHSIGWPLDSKTYGGSFLYHLENNQVAVGFVVGLDYPNPYLSPFEEFQRFKTHPAVRDVFENGRRIAYGARALSEGGLQSIPRLTIPGALLVGDAAGFLNVAKIKGSHTAMKSGMVAAEAIFDALTHPYDETHGLEVVAYPERLRQSWLWSELKQVRNIRPSFHHGLWAGLVYSAIDTYLLAGKAPWTLHHKPDHTQLGKAKDWPKIDYPKPDGKVSFDRLSSVFISNTNHEENQPAHLTLLNPEIAISVNLALYDSPETRYCPAGVYEILRDGESGRPRLVINAQNCLHCKSCDIKDPTQNIVWKVPEGGGGPNYPNM
ncbi:MAG: electron transfer flavoprotein-ubiquinone oxidoreductase [Alphaproteobacteria bacterium]|nr:electron transfer flavoprotein-ubiquinone oxidoreductase [Alphaproteobacteria bacterium]